MTENENERQKVIDYIQAMLGSGMVDVELDPVHYNTAIDRALNKFRQWIWYGGCGIRPCAL
jgi:hypothetical protein